MVTAFWFFAAPILIYIIVHIFVPNEPIDRENREMFEEMKEAWKKRVNEDRI